MTSTWDDPKIIIAIIGVVGIVLSALFSSIGYFYKLSIDRKKTTRKVLYLLLEIRSSITKSIFDPTLAADVFINRYIEKLNARGIKLKKTDFSQEQLTFMADHFKNIITSTKIDIESRLLKPFEDALFEMSSINPILAFKIRGKEQIENVIAHSQNYQKNIENYFSVEKIPVSLRNDLKEQQEAAIKDFCLTLDHDLLMLAKSCSICEYYKCRSVLKNGININNQYDFSDMDKCIDDMVDALIEEYTKSPPNDLN